ncbi:hypothetical protein ACEPU4_23510, partial [Pseudomonas aeruginosa]|uniref:hypothetical protein n=1 Tax=Pseudomonas aeruginosa TaxID=287 RepID=UPI001A7EEF35
QNSAHPPNPLNPSASMGTVDLGLVTNCISDLHRTLTCQKFANPNSLLFLVENEWWAVLRCHSA